MKRLIALLLISTQTYAGTVRKRSVCPNINEDAQNIRLKIETIKNQIDSTKPECVPIANSLESVNNLISQGKWSDYKDTISGENSTSLEDTDIDEVRELTSKATEAIGNIVSQLSGNSHCIKSDEHSFLGTIAGVTAEVSSLIGNTTGPYGMAVSLGGNIISGVIGGIDSLFKSRRGYQFINPEHETLFKNQFCAFTEIQQDIKDYIGMETRVDELAVLKGYLIEKASDLRANCELCDGYWIAAQTMKETDKILADLKRDAHILENPSAGTQRLSLSRCLMMENIKGENSSLQRFFNELQKYRDANKHISSHDQQLLDTVLANRNIVQTIFPTYGECLGMNIDEKDQHAQNYNSYVNSEILALNDMIFEQHRFYFKTQADKKFVNPLGDFTSKTYDRLQWIEKQARLVNQKLQDPNRPENLVAIQSDHEQLRNKLINQLMPIYLNFSINRITREMRSFRNEFARFKQQEQRKYKAQSISEITSKFSEEKSQSAVIFIGAVNNLMDKFSIADSRVKSLVRYCKYLIYTSNLYGKNESYCTTDTRIANAFKTLNQYKEDIEALRKFEKWAYENLDIQGSRVSDYAKKIDDWIAQGDSRWTLAEQVPVIPPTLEETIAAEMENESSLFNLN